MILDTNYKWFKTIMRKHKYLELMEQRGWKLQIANSFSPKKIDDRYTTVYRFTFKRDGN